MAILIIDDAEEMRVALKSLLEAEGFPDVLTAPSFTAAEALLGLAEGDGSPPGIDVILMDILMPGVDGIAACRRLRADRRYRDVPIIMVTGQPAESLLAEAFEAGANDYVNKPTPVPVLLARLRLALRLKRELDTRKAREKELLEVTRQLEQANESLHKLSVQDELTGVANRRFFNAVLAQEWGRAVREVIPLSLILVDIDHFKTYNDTFGHPQGDVCLRLVAQALGGALRRPGDFVARYGGEEFAVILSHTGSQGAAAVADKLRQIVEALDIDPAPSPAARHVTISLGVATVVPERHAPPGSLVDAADQALYEAKRAGRNRVQVFTAGPAPAGLKYQGPHRTAVGATN